MSFISGTYFSPNSRCSACIHPECLPLSPPDVTEAVYGEALVALAALGNRTDQSYKAVIAAPFRLLLDAVL